MDCAVSIRQVTKRYGPQDVLKGINCEIGAGESFGLVGINGVGKTTLIKAILDHLQVDGGSITIFGVPSTQPGARARLAYLPERFSPPHFLTGRDFMRYMARLYRVSYKADDFVGMLKEVDLEPTALDKPVRFYSKGMAQKLGLAAIFHSAKDLLVMDEPLSGLDPKAMATLKFRFNSLRKLGHTLLFSTHMLADLEELCDRIGVLHNGNLEFTGSPRECCERYAARDLEQAYLRCIGVE